MFQNSHIAELAHDIAFAVYRVASLVEFSYLRKELEIAAVGLVSFLDLESIDTAKRLIKLGKSIEEIGEVNGEVLLRELHSLTAMMAEGEFPEERVEIDVEKLFNRQKNILPFKRQKEKVESKQRPSIKPYKRQTEILNFIRQLADGCRMADLANGFQGVSKRTLRNDVGSLIDGGYVERVGGRGPYSHLKATGGSIDRLDSQNGGDKLGDVIFLSEPQTKAFDTSE